LRWAGEVRETECKTSPRLFKDDAEVRSSGRALLAAAILRVGRSAVRGRGQEPEKRAMIAKTAAPGHMAAVVFARGAEALHAGDLDRAEKSFRAGLGRGAGVGSGIGESRRGGDAAAALGRKRCGLLTQASEGRAKVAGDPAESWAGRTNRQKPV